MKSRTDVIVIKIRNIAVLQKDAGETPSLSILCLLTTMSLGQY